MDMPASRRRSRLALRWLAFPFGLALAATLLAACGGGGGDDTITLYNGQHPQLTQALVDAFSKQTGITVRVRTDDGIVLADEILQEGSSSPADVYLTENSPELMVLSEHHLLAKLPASITGQIPARYNSPSGNWAGVALRVSALAYNSSLMSAAELPTTLLALAQPRWKGKLAVAPTDSDFVPLVGAVIAVYGTARARAWLAGLKANAVRSTRTTRRWSPRSTAGRRKSASSTSTTGTGSGSRSARATSTAGSTTSRIATSGSIENISGAAVLASSQHKTDAERFVSFLASAPAQRILAASDDYEYPARQGVAAESRSAAVAQVDPAVLSVVRLGDDQRPHCCSSSPASPEPRPAPVRAPMHDPGSESCEHVGVDDVGRLRSRHRR